MNNKKKIIYIMADNRSGSTLLQNILAKSDECFSVGELAMLKGHLVQESSGKRWNWKCSCGEPFSECNFWKPLIEQIYKPDPEKFNTQMQWQSKSKFLFFRSLFPGWLKGNFIKLINTPHNKSVLESLNLLYNAIAERSAKNVIIDSSKNPIQALGVYKNIKEFDVKIIWLKRDLRAISASKKKWKAMNKSKEKSLRKLVFDVFYYRRVCYAVSKLIGKNDLITITYETLATNTETEVNKIIQWAGLREFVVPKYMELVKDHTIGGTAERFTKKVIQLDESWKEKYKHQKLIYMLGGLLNKLSS